MSNEFKDLSVEELTKGYIINDDGTFKCIFCGEVFEGGIIYSSRGRNVICERAVNEHVYDEHGGVFKSLISLDKQMNGLSDSQKTLFSCIYDEKDNKEISKEMDITVATVRTHKFNLQKTKRESKIFLALMEHIENEKIIGERKRIQLEADVELETSFIPSEENFSGNTLHPFFTQTNLK